MARNIESPGVQISEIDLSLNASLPIGTNVLINGFTDQGPAQELLNVTSISEYEQIYGVPTNAAERYSYHTMKNLLSTPAKVIFNRLPYGNTAGDGYNDKYTALLYPAYTQESRGSSYALSGDYFIGAPTQVTIDEDTYDKWKEGELDWSDRSAPWMKPGSNLGTEVPADPLIRPEDAAFIIVNKLQTSVNQDFEGFYVSLSDNRKASGTSTTTDFEFDSVTSVLTSKSHDEGTTVPENWEQLNDSRLDFELSGNISDKPNTISEAVETIPTWDIGTTDYNDALVIGLYKFRRAGSGIEQNALQFVHYEGYVGSLGKNRKYTEPTGFQETTFFMESILNDNSAFMDIMVNPKFSEGNWADEHGKPNKTIRIFDGDVANLFMSEALPTEITVGHRHAMVDANGTYTRTGITSGGTYIFTKPSYWPGSGYSSVPAYTISFDSLLKAWIAFETNDPSVVKHHLLDDSGAVMPPSSVSWTRGEIDIDTAPSPFTASIYLYNYSELPVDVVASMRSDSAFTFGLYQEKVNEVKSIGDIPTKLKLGLRLAEDYEVIPLDIVLDAGLSTIHTTMNISGGEEFIDVNVMDTTSLNDPTSGFDSPIAEAWLAVFNQFDIFCRDTRKDCMFIADVYRNILIDGKDFKVLDDKTMNFSQHVYTPLKNLVGKCNSSYSATYAQWIKVYDGQSSEYSWVPYSGFQGAIMARLDSILYPWSAPAGLENGLVVGGLTMALPTTQKQRDLLYRNNLNAVVFFPTDGMVCWGQKTLQKKPSAFDRINVRRLFLTLEKATRSLMKYFVFQPNTTFTRTRVVNILTPLFDVAKNNEGVYDYLIVCDERNNTPTVIDNNEMKVDIYLKPVRTAEFILVNFYATRSDQDFNELI